jgi:hypothetical protein
MKRLANPSMIAMLAVLALAGVPAAAGSLAGVSLPDTAEVGGQRLVLNGIGLRKKLFIKVYVAGFYLPAKQRDAAAILAADTPRRGVMHFVFSVGAEKICNEGWKEGLDANTANPSAELRAKFDTLCAYMEDMEDGDAMSFDYVPDAGTTVTVKGKTKGVIAGKDFSDALFGCWIGPRPGPGADFKKALLAG